MAREVDVNPQITCIVTPPPKQTSQTMFCPAQKTPNPLNLLALKSLLIYKFFIYKKSLLPYLQQVVY